jgi:flavin-dependent dehydrogenase
MRKNDTAIVVGGGPAGLGAAIALRSRGLRVTVVDSARPPIEKVCGEGLLPDTLASLRAIGVEPRNLAGVPFHGIRYVGNHQRIESTFPHGWALGIRRTELHRALLSAAERSGADFLWETPVEGIEPGGVRISGRILRAKWIIGADGSASRVRAWAGLGNATSSRQRFAFRRHFQGTPWTDLLEVHWGQQAQAYVAAVGNDEICVVLMSRDPRLRISQAMKQFPELASHLAACLAIDKERGATSRNCVLRRVTRGQVALVGDASGTVDAITGEGIGLAFRQAHALAEAIASDNLSAYESAHRRLRRKPQAMAKILLAMGWSEFLQERTLNVLAEKPKVFEHLLTAHVGGGSAMQIAGAGLQLGWGLLTA